MGRNVEEATFILILGAPHSGETSHHWYIQWRLPGDTPSPSNPPPFLFLFSVLPLPLVFPYALPVSNNLPKRFPLKEMHCIINVCPLHVSMVCWDKTVWEEGPADREETAGRKSKWNIAAVSQPSRDWILLTTSCNLEMFAFSFLVNFWLR